MMWFWILFALATGIGGLYMLIKGKNAWLVILGIVMAMILCPFGLYQCAIEADKDPAPIVETDYDYCPYCGAEMENEK